MRAPATSTTGTGWTSWPAGRGRCTSRPVARGLVSRRWPERPSAPSWTTRRRRRCSSCAGPSPRLRSPSSSLPSRCPCARAARTAGCCSACPPLAATARRSRTWSACSSTSCPSCSTRVTQPSLREMTRRVLTEVSESVRHAGTPFDRIQRELRRDGLPPLAVQVCVNQPANDTVPAGMSLVDLPMAPAGSQFELTLHVMTGNGGRLLLHLEHSGRLFDAESAQRLLDDFGTDLAALLADPDAPAPRILSGAGPEPEPEPEPERELGSGAGAPLLPDAVLAQAVRTPLRCAVETPEATLTYRELVRRARQVAAELRQWELPAGAVVLVCLRRGTGLVPALLGCWFAGCGYLPVDPDQPAERIAALLAESGASAILTDRDAWPDAIPHALPLVTVTSLADAGDDVAAEAWTAPQTHPMQVAYGILTSGSTGRPKTAAVTHAGIANRVRHSLHGTGIREADRVLQKTRLAFDAAAWEIFAPLTIGGTVVLAAPGVEADPARLVAEIAARRITVLQAVPSVLRLLLDAPGWEGCTEPAPRLQRRRAADRRAVRAAARARCPRDREHLRPVRVCDRRDLPPVGPAADHRGGRDRASDRRRHRARGRSRSGRVPDRRGGRALARRRRRRRRLRRTSRPHCRCLRPGPGRRAGVTRLPQRGHRPPRRVGRPALHRAPRSAAQGQWRARRAGGDHRGARLASRRARVGGGRGARPGRSPAALRLRGHRHRPARGARARPEAAADGAGARPLDRGAGPATHRQRQARSPGPGGDGACAQRADRGRVGRRCPATRGRLRRSGPS